MERRRRSTLCVDPTEHLIHQIFLPNKDANWRTHLPTLTGSDEVNVQLYALLGLICRQFVQSWHGNITKDKTFMNEVVGALAAVVQNLEARAVDVDVDEIVLDGVPLILQTHVEDIRAARARAGSGVMPKPFEEAFHSLRPHPALESTESEQLFKKVLAKALMTVLLDDNNIKSPPARTLISSVINEIVLKTAVERLSEPWFVYEMVNKVIDHLESSKAPAKQQEVENTKPTNLASIYKRVVDLGARTVALGGRAVAYIVSLSNESGDGCVAKASIFGCINTVLRLDQRMPLLVALANTISLPFYHGKLAQISTRAASRVIRQAVNESTVAKILMLARQNLFPNNGPMGPPRKIPDQEETQQLRDCAKRGLMKTRAVGDADELLDLFANKQVNKHLVYNLLDYVIVTLVPELVDQTPVQIQSSRI